MVLCYNENSYIIISHIDNIEVISIKKFVCFIFVLAFILIYCNNIDSKQKIRLVNTVSQYQKPTVILDAGHGGFDGGAVKGVTLEKDINLQFALSLECFFKAFGFSVVMTRTTDNGTQDSGLNTIREKKVSDIKNRLNLIENTDIECFISLHQNIFQIEKYSGTQVFFGQTNAFSRIYAENIQGFVKQNLQPENTRSIKGCERNIYLMYHTTKPAVLVECGFMSNYNELSKLLDENYQNKLNFCIINGILNGRKSIFNG